MSNLNHAWLQSFCIGFIRESWKPNETKRDFPTEHNISPYGQTPCTRLEHMWQYLFLGSDPTWCRLSPPPTSSSPPSSRMSTACPSWKYNLINVIACERSKSFEAVLDKGWRRLLGANLVWLWRKGGFKSDKALTWCLVLGYLFTRAVPRQKDKVWIDHLKILFFGPKHIS